MSLKASKEVESNRVELEIAIDGETFSAACVKVYKKQAKKIRIPGFRPGKAPMHMVEKLYGENYFYEDALNELFGDALEDAAKEAGIEIVDHDNSTIKFELVSVNKQDGVDFKVTVTKKPSVEVGTYKGLEAEKVKCQVTAEEVDAEVNRVADRNARTVTVEDRAAEMGDIAVIDFAGSVDGVPFDGGTAESYSLELGSGSFIPGFEEQVVGHNSEEEFDVNVTFPEDYQAEELKGKAAVFHCKLHEIKKRELPAIDDEFAKDVSEFDTIAEYKADVQAKIAERKEKDALADVENQLMEQVVNALQGEIPEAMYETRTDELINQFTQQLQMQGLDFNTYLQYMGGDVNNVRAQYRPQAESQVKLRLALEKIVELEGLTASEEEVSAKYEKMAQMYGVAADKVKEVIPEKEVSADLVVEKAVELIKAEAKIKEVDKKTEKVEKKPAAKKSTAKKTTKKAEGEDGEKKLATKKTSAKKPAAKKTADKAADEAASKPEETEEQAD